MILYGFIWFQSDFDGTHMISHGFHMILNVCFHTILNAGFYTTTNAAVIWLRMSQLYDWKYLRRRPMRGRNFRVSRFSQITWWFRMSGNVRILLNFLDVPRASWPCRHRALHVGSQCGVSRHPRITKRSIKSLPTIQKNWSQIAPWGLLGELWGFSWCQTSTRPT